MNVNTAYKDSVFTLLFSKPDLLRELYGALEGIELPPDIPVTINTLQDVVFMDKINDISFEIGGKLVVLIEHQSTINPNMATRLLMYIGRVYEKIIGEKNIYATQLVSLPRPEFFVLYNGSVPYPDEKILKLSDAFEDATSIGLQKNNIALELTVRVLNINHGKNAEIAQKCKTLAQYSAFVARAQAYKAGGLSLAEALKKAVQYCVKHDILKEFLEQNATEVLNMLTAEWDWDVAKEVWCEESREQEREEIARNALAEGLSPTQVQKITGLEMDVIQSLQSQL